MIDRLLAVVAGYLAARLVWVSTRTVFAGSWVTATNYRGESLPTAAGIIIPLVVIIVEAGRAIAAAVGVGDAGGPPLSRTLVIAVVTGFALLGLVDDVAGDARDHGFRGHLAAMAEGRLTTGALKLLGGGALATVVVSPAAGGSLGRLAADAALVALAANLGNLLDRGPGRAIKATIAAFVVLALATQWSAALSGVAVVVGCALALLLDDLHERLMLGDAGSNVLGATVGFGAVAACAPSTRNALLAVLVALNVAAEVVSFSRIIDAVPPLRAIDRAGRLSSR